MHCVTILYHNIENTVIIRAAHNLKVGCNTVEETTAILYFDWLNFLRHGIENEYVFPRSHRSV